MNKDHLKFLCCPACKGDLKMKASALVCVKCGSSYKLVKGIPRFVPVENYASNFGLEWNIHSKSQYDSHSGTNLSEKRFFEETGWERNLKGQTILEVGSGSGRFTEHAASTGAMVVSMDYSNAVEANYASNGSKSNVLIVQGSVYAMPFKEHFFDKVFCIGVLQHTPDPHKSFMCLPKYLKKGGSLVIDVYKKVPSIYFSLKYYVRPFTKRIPPRILYPMVKRYIDFMWPLAGLFRKISKHGKNINWALLIADYSKYGLEENILKEWAYLDTFDMLSPVYDYPQTLATVKRWVKGAKLVNVEVKYGYNGIEAKGSL